MERIVRLLLLWGLGGMLIPSAVLPQNYEMPYEISYLGIPLLDMHLRWVENDSLVSVSYDNRLKPLISFIHPIHNVYEVVFRKSDFYPLSWSKTISEGDLDFYSQMDRQSTTRILWNNQKSLDFPAQAYTVFSATHFLASQARVKDFFPNQLKVYVDGQVWLAHVKRYDADQPHPKFHVSDAEVLIEAEMHFESGTSVLSSNDVLTKVIATEGTRFMLWVGPDGKFTKAQFGSFPRAVVMELPN